MGKKIVAGNWKMNKDLPEALSLIDDLKSKTQTSEARVLIFPSFICLSAAAEAVKGSNIGVGAQNMSQFESGAHTGAVSSSMIKSAGVQTVLLGHSERRDIYGETPKIIREKVDAAVKSGMEIVYCCGEQLEEREAENHFNVIAGQLKNELFHLDAEIFKNVIIAYEPVWAIGTGKTASAAQAQEMHQFIRKNIAEQYTDAIAQDISILYGGSCKPSNAKELFGMADVDGGLIGGASLKADDFFGVVNAY